MSKMYAHPKNKLHIVREPDTSRVTETLMDMFLPALSWADWDLLQELHKAQDTHSRHQALEGIIPASNENELRQDKPLLNKDAIIADLRDQIGDWEVKCKQLDSRIESQQQTISSISCENGRLSKSLQQYRAAYFADTTPAPQLGGIGASDLTGGPTHDQPI